MRLTETKGLAPFHSEFIDYYVHRLNGTCFDSGMRQRLVLRRMDRGILLPLEVSHPHPILTQYSPGPQNDHLILTSSSSS